MPHNTNVFDMTGTQSGQGAAAAHVVYAGVPLAPDEGGRVVDDRQQHKLDEPDTDEVEHQRRRGVQWQIDAITPQALRFEPDRECAHREHDPEQRALPHAAPVHA